MFQKIKSFFSAPEPKKIEIDEKEFKNWLEKEIKKNTETFKTHLKEVNKDIDDLKKATQEKLNELDEKKIEDVRVPVRIRNKFGGNRESFRKNIENFFSKLPSIQADEDLVVTEEKLKSILDELNKANHRPAIILKNFFSNEVMEIGNDIKSIEKCYKKAKDIHDNLNLGTLKKAKADLDEYYHEKERIKAHKKNVFALEKELETLENEINEVKNKIKKIERNPEYKKIQKLIKEREQIDNNITYEKEKIRNSFISLSQAIKKFARASLDEEIGNSFLESVDDTLILFDKKRIMDFLNGLQKSLEKGSLELKDKKREKSLIVLKKIDSEFIDSFKLQISQLQEKRHEIDNIIESSELIVNRNQLKDQQEQLEYKKKQKLREVNLEKSKEDMPRAKTPKVIAEELNDQLKEIELVFVDK
ncbi:MAG: coiled-coil domain-containing protein [Candidatus Nanoarchaeia archaeon]